MDQRIVDAGKKSRRSMATTKIEWAERVWNPVTGCTKVSPGCQNCYAERMAKRLRGRYGYPQDDPFKVTLHPDRLQEPVEWLKWRKPKMIFVCSMGDLFHEDVPFDFIDRVFAMLSWGQAKDLDNKFLILTKRPERMLEYFKQRDDWFDGELGNRSRLSCFENTWLGVTAENQEQADKRIPILLQIPAAKRFVSIEPMLGDVALFDIEKLDWIIVGAESGQNRRECKNEWVRDIIGQCKVASIPVFIKQLHDPHNNLSKNPAEWPEDLRVREYPG